MPYTEQEIRTATTKLTQSFGELLNWQWDEQKHVLLAEFASGKTYQVMAILQQNFPHEWNRKTIKKAPTTLTHELGDYAKLVKEQRIFTISPQDNEKSIAAFLWPWGHGSTLSLRLTLLSTPYQYVKPENNENFIVKFFQKAKNILA